MGPMRPTAQLNHRVSHVLPIIKTQGFARFNLNHLHGFYMAHPKPSPWFYVAHPKTSPWVLYGSPKTFIVGFIWFTRNQHHGFYNNPFRETKSFNICLIISINQSIRVLCGLPTSTNFKKTQTTNLFTVRNCQHHIQLDKHRPHSIDLLR